MEQKGNNNDEIKLNGKDFWKWAGKMETMVGSNSKTLEKLENRVEVISENTKTEFKELRNCYDNLNHRLISIEKNDKDPPKDDDEDDFISWKWIVEKLTQPVLMAVIIFIVSYVLTQVLK